MSFKNVILACASVVTLSTPAFAQDLNEFQVYVSNLHGSLENIAAARTYLESQSLWNAEYEKQLDRAKDAVMMSSYSLGQWILPGISYRDARNRLSAFCDYNFEAELAWIHMNRLLGEEQNQRPEWQDLFKKAKKDLPMPCGD